MLWIGRRESVGIGVESTRGVGVAPSYWLNCLSFTFKDVPTRAVSEAGFGGIWAGDQAPKTMEHAEGEFEIEVGDQSLGALLVAVFGDSPSTSGPTDTAAYTHTFTLSNTNQHKSLTIHTVDPIGQLVYEMAMIDTFELRVEPDSIITARVSFISKGSTTSAGQSASYGAEKKFVGRYLTFKVASDTSGLDAASAISLKSLILRFEKNAEAQATLSTVQPEDIVNKRFNISGEIVLNYEDRTWLNYVKNASDKAVRIDIVHEDTITGCASTKYQFRLDLSKVAFESWDSDFAMDDVVTQTLSFTAFYDAGGNNNVVNSCYLVNGVTSY